MLQFINRLLGRNKSQLPPFDFARNRYRARTTWPPNLRHLTHKQQFRYERKYKRRVLMKSINPTWNKWVKIVTWTIISGFTIYTVFFYDFRNDPWNPRPGEQSFEPLRNWCRERIAAFWTHTSIGGTRRPPPPEPSRQLEPEERRD